MSDEKAIRMLIRLKDCINFEVTDAQKKIDALNMAIEALKQPKIIRCKDCKYCEHWYADKGRCVLWHEGGIGVFEEGFCNYAERREEWAN